MPSSRPIAINYVCNKILEINPMSVLDIGIGFGKFGFLAREYTDIWHGRYFKWETKIEGIEAFERYVGLLQRLVYDKIHIGDALNVILQLDYKYDLIICSDMLEHLEKDRGLELLKVITKKGKYSIIVLPIFPSPQGNVYGNEYERHRARWDYPELEKFGQVKSILKNNTFILEIKGGE